MHCIWRYHECTCVGLPSRLKLWHSYASRLETAAVGLMQCYGTHLQIVFSMGCLVRHWVHVPGSCFLKNARTPAMMPCMDLGSVGPCTTLRGPHVTFFASVPAGDSVIRSPHTSTP